MEKPLPPEAGPPCPVCGSAATSEFFRQAGVPVHQHLLLDSPAAARGVSRGTLALRVCPSCDFVFNAAFDPALLDYGCNYDNSQNHSEAFTAYLDGLVRHLVEERGVRDCRIVEVGCGKGAFLRKLVEAAGGRTTGVGFDPTYVGPPEELGGRVQFRPTWYGAENSVPADVVVCRHVIEHVAGPPDLLRAVRTALGQGPARVFLETPCVAWSLRGQVVWDFFFEHCSLFTRRSLGHALAAAGFVVGRLAHVFGGQYLWAEAAVTGAATPGPAPEGLGGLASRFGRQWRDVRADWETLLRRLKASGDVVVWGAGAKGVTFCNLADPQAQRVNCVIDVNPAKQGKFVAGTGHPIVAPGALRPQTAAVLVLNPNYLREVTAYLRGAGVKARVIDLMSGAKLAA
jgi:hypothetical protein